MKHKMIHLIQISSPYMGVTVMNPPSGILYVGGYLKRHGFPVKIHHIWESEIDGTVEEIRSGGPVLFAGFSTMTGIQVTLTARMSIKLKESNPEIPVVWGGIHPSLMPEECLKFDFVDYVVIGEGEVTALELARRLNGSNGLPPEDVVGTGLKRDGKIVIAEPRPFAKDIDDFKQDWSLVNINDYVLSGNVFPYITSRGCPHSCGFCYNQMFNKRRYRPHSIEKVINELIEIKRATGITRVYFSDDNYFTDRKRGLEILRRLRQHGISCVGLEVRVDYITEELAAEMVDLGVESIFFGWESGCEQTLNKIAKGFSPGLILEKLRILSRFKQLHIDCSAIIGFPWETYKDVCKTVDFALKMFRVKPFGLAIYMHIYLPYPGAPVTSEAEARGFAFPRDHEGWSKFDEMGSTMELPWLTRKMMRKYSMFNKYANLLNLNPRARGIDRFVRYMFAFLAYARLKTRVLVFPFEIRLLAAYKVVYNGINELISSAARLLKKAATRG